MPPIVTPGRIRGKAAPADSTRTGVFRRLGKEVRARVEQLRRAIDGRRKVRFVYRDEHGAASERGDALVEHLQVFHARPGRRVPARPRWASPRMTEREERVGLLPRVENGR